MNTTPNQAPNHYHHLRRLVAILVAFCVTALHYPLLAQPQPPASTPLGLAPADSAQGYWRLNTQVATRNTVAQFFAPDHRLLYQELLPEKWIKLTRKNQRQFDQLLEQLMANRLLSTRIRTQPLPAIIPHYPLASPHLVDDDHRAEPTGAKVHAYLSQAGKLRVIVDNPQRKRYTIELVDERNLKLYQEFTNHNQYRRWLDVAAVPPSSYQLVIKFDQRPIIYHLTSQATGRRYQIQPVTFSQR